MIDLQNAGIVVLALGWVWEALRLFVHKGEHDLAHTLARRRVLPFCMLLGGLLLASGEYVEGSLGLYGALLLVLSVGALLVLGVRAPEGKERHSAHSNQTHEARTTLDHAQGSAEVEEVTL